MKCEKTKFRKISKLLNWIQNVCLFKCLSIKMSVYFNSLSKVISMPRKYLFVYILFSNSNK